MTPRARGALGGIVLAGTALLVGGILAATDAKDPGACGFSVTRDFASDARGEDTPEAAVRAAFPEMDAAGMVREGTGDRVVEFARADEHGTVVESATVVRAPAGGWLATNGMRAGVDCESPSIDDAPGGSGH